MSTSSNIITRVYVPSGKDSQLEYQLVRDERLFVFRRLQVFGDGSKLDVHVPLDDAAQLSELFESEHEKSEDEKFDSVGKHSFVSTAIQRGLPAKSVRRPFNASNQEKLDFHTLSVRASTLGSTAELDRLLVDVAGATGCAAFMLVLGAVPDHTPPHHYIFSRGPSQWLQTYIGNRQYLVDPHLSSLAQAIVPVGGSKVPLVSDGQRTFRRDCQVHGLTSSAAFPVRAKSDWLHSNFGGLVCYGPSAEPLPERRLMNFAAPIHGVSAYAVQWWMRDLVAAEAGAIHLSQQEESVLALLAQGLSVGEVNVHTGLTESALYNTIRRVKGKLKATRIESAYARAQELAAAFGAV